MELKRLIELTVPADAELTQKLRDAQAYMHVLYAMSLIQVDGNAVVEPVAYLRNNDNVVLEWILPKATLKVEFTGAGGYIYSRTDATKIVTQKKNLRHTLDFI